MNLHSLSPAAGSRKSRKRVGRGNASGHGTYSTRGSKGQNSRSGAKRRPGLEGGGTLPSILHLPRKRGFTNIYKKEYSVVNIDQLAVFAANSDVTPQKMVEGGLLKNLKFPVKILGNGELKQALNVKANRFSGTAKAKIETAGGKIEEINASSPE